jgi:hypothetical protein
VTYNSCSLITTAFVAEKQYFEIILKEKWPTGQCKGDICPTFNNSLNIIMTIYTYIPVKNCNIVQNEADVAIMSLNPSIVNYQTVDCCISRKKETDT